MGWDSGDRVVGIEIMGWDDGGGGMKLRTCNGMEA